MKHFFLSLACLFLLLSACGQKNSPLNSHNMSVSVPLNINLQLLGALDSSMAPFYHGVASGDPTQNAVIIWTKVTLLRNIKNADVSWEMATDNKFANIVSTGTKTVNAEHHFILKEDIKGLKPGTRYFYRFKYNNITSITGETQTLPQDAKQFDIAFASCSNLQWGYFNNYRFIAEDTSVDLVIHLGDYIYEYGANVYGNSSLGRVHVPETEIITLDDYRTRYSQYRLDKDLQKAHQLKPFITTWDDHEIANNTYKNGAQNHQPEEGDFMERLQAAKQAYYEWLPVRENANKELYRNFSCGKLFNLLILDTRVAGRTEQVNSVDDEKIKDTSRTILGAAQYNWMLQNLEGPQTWNIIGNQVSFGPFFLPDKVAKEKYMDGWDGYPYERAKLVNTLLKKNIRNNVFITGDYHSAFAFETDLSATAASGDNIGAEFIVTSISSANDDEHESSKKKLEEIRKNYYKNNPHLKYVNNTDHGYLVLHISPENVKADFYYASTILETNAVKKKEKTFMLEKGKGSLTEVK